MMIHRVKVESTSGLYGRAIPATFSLSVTGTGTVMHSDTGISDLDPYPSENGIQK
jgi:hypothetical protein